MKMGRRPDEDGRRYSLTVVPFPRYRADVTVRNWPLGDWLMRWLV